MSDSFDDDNQPPKNTPADDYKVGYKKPPKEHQFKPGQRGHGGRKKGSKNLKTMLEEELSALIAIREGNGKRKISRQQAIIKKLVIDALNGKTSAFRQLFELVFRFYDPNDDQQNNRPLSADDQAFLLFLQQRFPKKSS